jgi:hypothetical protein
MSTLNLLLHAQETGQHLFVAGLFLQRYLVR